MTHSISKNLVFALGVAAFATLVFALPQTSDAKTRCVGMRCNMASSTASSTKPYSTSTKPYATSTKPSSMKDLSCVQTAVADREEAVVESWEDFSEAMNLALTERREDLIAAWKLTDMKARNTALKTLWQDWRTASKKAHATLKADRKAAWSTFRNTMKNDCKVKTLPKEDAEPKDASGVAL